MSEKYKSKEPNACYYMTCTVVGWIDVFTRKIYRDIVLESLKYCREKKGFHIYAYVIMTNHIHLIGWVEEPNKMSDVIRDFKRYTAQAILKSIENEPESRREWLLHMFKYFGAGAKNREQYQFWQDGYHPVQLWSDKVIMQKMDYLHLNPVRAGFVNEAFEWKYSSATNYARRPSLLDVEIWWPSNFITVK
jgi:putative transposase